MTWVRVFSMLAATSAHKDGEVRIYAGRTALKFVLEGEMMVAYELSLDRRNR